MKSGMQNRTRAAAWASALGAVGVLAAGACERGPAPGQSTGPASSPATAPPTTAPPTEIAETEASEPTQVEPVYPKGPVTPDARAQRFCTALHEAPARQRAACCGRPPPTGGQTAAECTRLLSSSLAQGAVTLDEAAVEACVAALEKTETACSAMGRFTPPPPAVCTTVVRGRRASGAACRSDLECEGSLQCLGAGPTQPGVCAGPRPPGAPCGTAADVLTTYTRLSETEKDHPECEGLCVLHRCAPFTPPGGACVAHLQCGEGQACVAGKCAARPHDLPEGAACPGLGCAAGTQCVAGACRKPAPAGAVCETDFECEGACLKKNILDKKGTCGLLCQ
jgi:hypothetical protein